MILFIYHDINKNIIQVIICDLKILIKSFMSRIMFAKDDSYEKNDCKTKFNLCTMLFDNRITCN